MNRTGNVVPLFEDAATQIREAEEAAERARKQAVEARRRAEKNPDGRGLVRGLGMTARPAGSVRSKSMHRKRRWDEAGAEDIAA
jgi:hypothetical protein